MRNYNNSYFDKIKIHLLIKVPFKFMFETNASHLSSYLISLLFNY